MRAFASTIQILTASGEYLYRLHGEAARLMVESGVAEIAHANGRVRSVRLTKPTAWFAQRIGPPSEWRCGVSFSVKEKLESGGVVWRHHSRATWL